MGSCAPELGRSLLTISGSSSPQTKTLAHAHRCLTQRGAVEVFSDTDGAALASTTQMKSNGIKVALRTMWERRAWLQNIFQILKLPRREVYLPFTSFIFPLCERVALGAIDQPEIHSASKEERLQGRDGAVCVCVCECQSRSHSAHTSWVSFISFILSLTGALVF